MEFHNFHPDKIKVVSLLAVGRASTLFIQGLFDQHPEIVTIILLYPAEKLFKKNDPHATMSNIYNQISERVEDYFRKYDFKKNVPKGEFFKYFKEYIDTFGLTPKTMYIAAHYAYAKTSKKDISKIKYILAHVHWAGLFADFQKYFPSHKIIFAVKDPRATFVSAKKKNFLLSSLASMCLCMQLYKKLRKKRNKDTFVIKHELLHKKYINVRSKLVKFLGIKDDSSLNSSTFFGAPFGGAEGKSNTHSITGIKSSTPNKKFVNELWKEELSTSEIRFTQFLFSSMMKLFDYKPIKCWDNIKINCFSTSYDLSLSHTKRVQGLKKVILFLCRYIFFVPLIGPFILKIFLCFKIIFEGVKASVKIRFTDLD